MATVGDAQPNYIDLGQPIARGALFLAARSWPVSGPNDDVVGTQRAQAWCQHAPSRLKLLSAPQRPLRARPHRWSAEFAPQPSRCVRTDSARLFSLKAPLW